MWKASKFPLRHSLWEKSLLLPQHLPYLFPGLSLETKEPMFFKKPFTLFTLKYMSTYMWRCCPKTPQFYVAERRRIDAFELWCWRRFLRVPWTAGRSNQSILKEISLGISLEGIMLKNWNSSTSATSCEELTHWKRLWCWEGLGAGEEGDDRGWDGWMASLTWWTWVWVNSGSWWWTGRPGVLWFMGSQRVGHD